MGGVCTKNVGRVKKYASTKSQKVKGVIQTAKPQARHEDAYSFSQSLPNVIPPEMIDRVDKERKSALFHSVDKADPPGNAFDDENIDYEVRQPVPTNSKWQSKVSDSSSHLRKADNFEAVKSLNSQNTFVSSKTNPKNSDGLKNSDESRVTPKSNQIAILAFEVANTIVKGSNLMQSISAKSVQHLKESVLHSEGVQLLISNDMVVLIGIVAADRREELKVFSREVIRFGNHCKDSKWHNLNCYFEKLGSEVAHQKIDEGDAQTLMEELMSLVQQTAELYQEMNKLDTFEQEYRRKKRDMASMSVVSKADDIHKQVKSQRKHVKALKDKSLWSKILDEVMQKLVDIVCFLYLEIQEVFGSAEVDIVQHATAHKRLGPAGLALHYANVISQIDTTANRSAYVPQSTRDMLYQALPPSTKSALRSKLQSFHVNEELSVAEIKSEMNKILQWLLPMANNTTKAHHGFGWVGEWANAGTQSSRKPIGKADATRLETLHYAQRDKTESFILDLVLWLHHLIIHSKSGNGSARSTIRSPIRSRPRRSAPITCHPKTMHNQEDQNMLRVATSHSRAPGVSQSQDFGKKSSKDNCTVGNSTTRTSSSLDTQMEIDDDKWDDALDSIDIDRTDGSSSS